MAQRLDISGLDKAELVAALFNRSKSGYSKDSGTNKDMTIDQAREAIAKQGGRARFPNELHGRPMMVDLDGDSFDPSGYDGYVGEGAARRVVVRLQDEARAARLLHQFERIHRNFEGGGSGFTPC